MADTATGRAGAACAAGAESAPPPPSRRADRRDAAAPDRAARGGNRIPHDDARRHWHVNVKYMDVSVWSDEFSVTWHGGVPDRVTERQVDVRSPPVPSRAGR
ncbi:hypothetical protein GCM10010478_29140 [Streptomyces erythrogriseus]|uniref:Uncharacterized protein n=2 Tax=Streptomyces TaxID=1883 RepID=A0ABN3WTV1_9ACTN